MRECVKGLFLLLLALLPCVCPARDESLFAYAARKYEFDSWRGQTKAAYARRLTSYDLPLLPLMTNSPTVRVDRHGKNSLKRLYVRHDGDLPSSLRIVTGVATSEVAAQEFMIRHLGTCLMGCHDYTLYEIGDRGYSVITNQTTRKRKRDVNRDLPVWCWVSLCSWCSVPLSIRRGDDRRSKGWSSTCSGEWRNVLVSR